MAPATFRSESRRLALRLSPLAFAFHAFRRDDDAIGIALDALPDALHEGVCCLGELEVGGHGERL